MRRFLRGQIRLLLRPFLSPGVPLWLQRAWSDVSALSLRSPPGFARAEIQMDAVRGVRLTGAASRPEHGILYLHGGAYVLGSPASHSKLAAQIGHAAGATVYLPDYRLAPEHPYPAALDDALEAYRWLLKQGFKTLALAGDSAGGGLALATALSIRDAGLPAPSALVLMSPWVDLTLRGESHSQRAARDPMLRAAWLRFGARAYAGTRALDEPGLSPLFATLNGVAPLLIQAGSEEILHSDAERLAARARAAGVRVRFTTYEGLWHDFQAHAGMLPESDQALREIGMFLQSV